MYGGQKINGHPHMSFTRCMKLIDNKQNIYEKHSSTEGINIKVDSIALVLPMLSPLIHILTVSLQRRIYQRIHMMKDIPCEACEIESVKICIP